MTVITQETLLCLIMILTLIMNHLKKVKSFVIIINPLEVIKYAIYLGMNPEEDREFLYIARDGLKAPVPKPWRACQTKSGEIYYFNFESGESQWDHPCDDLFRKKFQEIKALYKKGHHKREE